MTTYLDKKIYYHDTDCGDVVYYANYLKYLEEGRTEFINENNINFIEYTKNNILFPVVHLEIDYKSPAIYGDKIRIYTFVEKIGNASISFNQEIKKGDKLLIKARIVLACVNKELRPIRIPEEFKLKIILGQNQ